MVACQRGALLVAAVAAAIVSLGASQPAAFRLLQAEYKGQQIGSKHYSAQGVSGLTLSWVTAPD